MILVHFVIPAFSCGVVRLLIGLDELSVTPTLKRIIPAVILGVLAVKNLIPISFVHIRNT